MNLKPQIQTLDNGLKIITLNIPQSQSVTALLMIKIGSRYEDDKLAGISHFLEHLPSKGTKKYPTAHDLAVTLDGVGAEHNAFTSKEYTGFYVKSASIHLELALEILSQLVFHSLLPSKEIEKEKGVIIEEINMYNDHPMAKVGSNFEKLIYPNSDLGRQVIGFKKTVKSFKRKDFLNYQKQWYKPERMVLGIVGGTSKIKNEKLKMKNLIEKYFSKNYPSEHAPARRRIWHGTRPNRQSEIARPGGGIAGQQGQNSQENELGKLSFIQQKPQLKIKYKKTEQTHLCLGVRTFPRGHKDRYAMAVLTTILGGNMSSRLFTEVREKRGLAYYIKSDIASYFDNGYLVSQAGVSINKAEEAVKVILEEYNKVQSASWRIKVQSGELRRAKEYLKGKFALGLEDSKDVAGFFVEDLLLEEKIRTPKEIVKEIEKVTLLDIKKIAQKIFVNQGLNLAIIGPYKEEGKFEKILKL